MSVRTYLIIAAVVTALGAGAGWYQSWKSGIIDAERARVAILRADSLQAASAAAEEVRIEAEAVRAERDSIAAVAASEIAVARREADEAGRVAAARVAAAEERVRVALASLDTVSVPPEAVEVIEAQAQENTALRGSLEAQVRLTAAADSATAIWEGRYVALETENSAFRVEVSALRDENAQLRAAISAAVRQADGRWYDSLVGPAKLVLAGFGGYGLAQVW